jgi:hypothetical protein
VDFLLGIPFWPGDWYVDVEKNNEKASDKAHWIWSWKGF